MIRPLAALLLCLPLLLACARNDLADPPVPLGDFALGLNIVVTTNMQKVPISREATAEEWEAALEKAIEDRFGRYEGSRVYNIGIALDAYAIAPPGIPVVAAPKSVLALTANIWDDAAEQKLNAEGKKLLVFEGFSGESVIGTGLTRTKEQQIAALSYNAAKAVERWLLENPEWFDIDPAVAAAALAASAAPPTAELPAAPPADAAPADAAQQPAGTDTAASTEILPPDLLSPASN